MYYYKIKEAVHSNAVQALAGGTITALKTWTTSTAMGKQLSRSGPGPGRVKVRCRSGAGQVQVR